MEVLKRESVKGIEVVLKRDKTNKPGKQYEYYVTKGGSIVRDPVYTLEDGRRVFGEAKSMAKLDARTGNGGNSGGTGINIPGLGKF